MGIFNMFSKKAKAAAVTVQKVENRDLMEAIVAGAILVAYADGDCSAAELQKLDSIISANDNLQHFGSELGKTIDKYSTIMNAGVLIGRLKLMKELKDIEHDEDQKTEAFIISIEVALADGEVDDKELAVLKEIGKAYGLNPEPILQMVGVL